MWVFSNIVETYWFPNSNYDNCWNLFRQTCPWKRLRSLGNTQQKISEHFLAPRRDWSVEVVLQKDDFYLRFRSIPKTLSTKQENLIPTCSIFILCRLKGFSASHNDYKRLSRHVQSVPVVYIENFRQQVSIESIEIASIIHYLWFTSWKQTR